MAYFSSPRTEKGTAERLADCYQCLSSFLSTRTREGPEQASDDDLITDAVEAGWDEDEVSTILQNIRRGAIANVVSEDLVSESAELPTSDPPDAAPGHGGETAQGLRESAGNEERRVELQKGSPLVKGEERFEERSRSSDGRSADEKQKP